MKAYLEAIRSFRKEINYYKMEYSKSSTSSKKNIYANIITQLEDELQNLLEKTKEFYESLTPREQTIVRQYYYEGRKLENAIYSENEIIDDKELDNAISDNGYRKSIIYKSRTWNKKSMSKKDKIYKL